MFSKKILEDLLNEVLSSKASDVEKDLARNLLEASHRFEDIALEELTLESASMAMYSYIENAPKERKQQLRPIFEAARARAMTQTIPFAVEICRGILQDSQTSQTERQLAERFLVANFKSFHGEVSL